MNDGVKGFLKGSIIAIYNNEGAGVDSLLRRAYKCVVIVMLCYLMFSNASFIASAAFSSSLLQDVRDTAITATKAAATKNILFFMILIVLRFILI